jgi:hypothetical protein
VRVSSAGLARSSSPGPPGRSWARHRDRREGAWAVGQQLLWSLAGTCKAYIAGSRMIAQAVRFNVCSPPHASPTLTSPPPPPPPRRAPAAG